jgi:hypothetical protein
MATHRGDNAGSYENRLGVINIEVARGDTKK